MRTAQMECFLQAASLLNFTAAAEKMYMTQPALSHQISNIENELNVKLFVRGNNAVRLTPAGQVLSKGLRGIFQDYKQLIAQVENVALGITGEFNIGLQEDLLLDNDIAAAVKRLKAGKPDININLHRRDMKGLWDGLSDGSLDVAVTLLIFRQQSGFEVRELELEPVYMAISKTAGADLPDKIDFEQFIKVLDEFPLTLITKQDYDVPLREAANLPLEELHRRGCHPFVNLVSSFDSLLPQIAAGLGVIIVNRTHVVSSDPGIRLIELDFEKTEREIWPNFRRGVLWRSQVTNNAVPMFLDILDQQLEEKHQD